MNEATKGAAGDGGVVGCVPHQALRFAGEIPALQCRDKASAPFLLGSKNGL